MWRECLRGNGCTWAARVSAITDDRKIPLEIPLLEPLLETMRWRRVGSMHTIMGI